MKLSVIVPVYNAAPWLGDCVGSLLAQSIDDYELILVDDGSTDESLELLRQYERDHPEKIKVLSVENGGQGRARNFGLEIARGDYVGFVDSDDWVLPEMYAKLYLKAEAEGADLVVCDVRRINADRSTQRLSTWRDGQPLSNAGSACDKLFKRELIGELRFPEGLWYEDFAFSAMALLRSRKTVYVPEMLYMYRCGQPSTMHNNNARRNLDMLRIMEQLRRFIAGGGGTREDFEFLLLHHVLLEAISRLARQSGPERKAVIAELRAYVREHVPRLGACRSFRQESARRRLVMRLNYAGLEDLAQALIRAKQRLDPSDMT